MRSLFQIEKEASLALKGIAILLVLLRHLGYVPWSDAGGVNLFLILSGYGLTCSIGENGLKDYGIKKFHKIWLLCPGL